jgi:hypothetical protein
MLAVLPAPGRPIQEPERQPADAPDSIDTVLQKRLGSVTMPIFHLKNRAELRPSLEEMGIKTMFSDLGEIVTIPKSHLTEVKQNVISRWIRMESSQMRIQSWARSMAASLVDKSPST